MAQLSSRVAPLPRPGMDHLAVEGGIDRLVLPACRTGVKVDLSLQHRGVYMCAPTTASYAGLSHSIGGNLTGTGIIAIMQQCNDFLFLGTRRMCP